MFNLRKKMKRNGKIVERRSMSRSYLTAGFFKRGKVVKFAIALASVAVIYLIFVQGKTSQIINLSLGQMCPGDIYATEDFRFVDQDLTKILKDKEANSVIPVYQINEALIDENVKRLEAFLNSIVEITNNSDLSFEDKLNKAREISPIAISDEDISVLIIANLDKDAIGKIIKSYRTLMMNGILSQAEKVKISQEIGSRINVIDGRMDMVKIKSIDSIVSIEDVNDYLTWQVKRSFSNSRLVRSLVSILEGFIDVDLVYDKAKTDEMKKSARENIKSEYTYVKKGQIIIRKGEEAKKRHLIELKAMNEAEAKGEKKENLLYYRFGIILITIIMFIFIWEYGRVYESRIFNDNAKILLVAIIFVITLSASKFILYVNENFEIPLMKYIILVPFASILYTLLLNRRMALVLTVSLSLYIALMNADRLDFAIIGLAGGVAAIIASAGTKHRWQILKIGFVVGIVNVVIVLAYHAMGDFTRYAFLYQSLSGLIGGLLCAILAAFFIPIFEYLFNIPTDLKLLEFLDLNHPLLKEMVINAPGTYHHSLMVGNLAEAAASAIGANPLVAKVAAYFHDVGKLPKPEYFSENEAYGKSFHQGLNPSMSSLIILSHVKDGADLAKKYKLPEVIIDVLTEHHGTSLVYYFYKKAERIALEGDTVEEDNYRYKGPRPCSKESGIILLADAVEAASRSLDKPTSSRIEGLIKDIINEKISDQQLNECDLTLKEIEIISKTFERILIAAYHSRIKYPKNEGPIKGNGKNGKKEHESNQK